MLTDEQRRRECWAEFCAAVEAALAGDNGPAVDLMRRFPTAYPADQDNELRKFARACKRSRTKKGLRFVRTADGWREVK